MGRRINQAKRLGTRGFTLIELLIVVVILAVLAAIVIPQFTSSTDEAKKAALKATLSQMRNAVELYYHQHGSVYPAAHLASTGLVGTPAAADFVAQLTLYTNLAGKTQATSDTTFKYGPYLKSPTLPTNPIDDSSALVLNVGASLGNLTTAVGTDAGGWWFDHVSGKFLANINLYATY